MQQASQRGTCCATSVRYIITFCLNTSEGQLLALVINELAIVCRCACHDDLQHAFHRLLWRDHVVLRFAQLPAITAES